MYELSDAEHKHYEELCKKLPFEELKRIAIKEEHISKEEALIITEAELREHIDDFSTEDYAYVRPFYGKMKRAASKAGLNIKLQKSLPLTDNVRTEDIVKAIIEKTVTNKEKVIAAGFDFDYVTNPLNWKRTYKWKMNDLWDRGFTCKKTKLSVEVKDDGEKITELKVYKGA